MRERRPEKRRGAARTVGPAGLAAAIGLRLWAKAAHRPVDTMAIFGAAAASLIIVVNAVFLQSGSHPAPFFGNPASPPPAAESRSNATGIPALRTAGTSGRQTTEPRTAQPVVVRRDDPIADLISAAIGSPSRVMAVQRVLSEFGYGQVRPSGILDEPTGAAIEKFESEHKLPVTGRLSVRLLNELAVMVGHPLD